MTNIDKINIINSPIVGDANYINDSIIINITLPNGIIITNPQQFSEDEYYYNNYEI